MKCVLFFGVGGLLVRHFTFVTSGSRFLLSSIVGCFLTVNQNPVKLQVGERDCRNQSLVNTCEISIIKRQVFSRYVK